MRAIAEKDGARISPGYWETMYRNTVQTAYNAGPRMQFDRAKPKAYALMVLEDERTSAICKPLVGLVLPADHPFWENHWPPFHFNCRTTVRGIYEEEGEISVQNIPMKQLRKEFRPQKGFGENPITAGSFYELPDNMAERALHYGILGDLKAFADKAGCRSVRLYNPDSLDGFELVQNYPSGGNVYKHERYGKKKLPEESIAHQLAKKAKVVKLLPRSDLLLSPDLWIDGEIWEVKTVSGTKTSIDNALRSKQAENIILSVTKQLDAHRLQAEIEELLNRRLHIKKVWCLSPNSEINFVIKNPKTVVPS